MLDWLKPANWPVINIPKAINVYVVKQKQMIDLCQRADNGESEIYTSVLL